MRISDWSSDVCSSDLDALAVAQHLGKGIIFGDSRQALAVGPDGLIDEIVGQLVAPGEGAQVRPHAGERLGEDLAAEGAVDGRELVQAQPADQGAERGALHQRSEEHTSEHQSLMRISYAVICLKKK